MSDGKSIKEILSSARPKSKSAWVCLRGDLLDRHEQLEKELFEAHALDRTENRQPQAPLVAQAIKDLEAEIAEEIVEFKFEAVGEQAWTDLLVLHPPTDEQLDQWRKEGAGYAYNPLTFPQAAVAASCVQPKMTEADVHALRALPAVNHAVWEGAIWDACFAVNVKARADAPFSAAASVVLSGSETKSEPPGTTESPAPSS